MLLWLYVFWAMAWAFLAQLRLVGLSSTIANRIADYVCRGVTPAALSTPIKISLHTADPGTTGASEVTGGSYLRQTAGYNAAASGACALAATLSFTGMPAVTVTHISLWDSAPIFLQSGALASSQAVGAGNTLQLTSATDTWTGT